MEGEDLCKLLEDYAASLFKDGGKVRFFGAPCPGKIPDSADSLTCVLYSGEVPKMPSHLSWDEGGEEGGTWAFPANLKTVHLPLTLTPEEAIERLDKARAELGDYGSSTRIGRSGQWDIESAIYAAQSLLQPYGLTISRLDAKPSTIMKLTDDLASLCVSSTPDTPLTDSVLLTLYGISLRQKP